MEKKQKFLHESVDSALKKIGVEMDGIFFFGDRLVMTAKIRTVKK